MAVRWNTGVIWLMCKEEGAPDPVDMPSLVRGDSARVIQTFANLISNSIKFTTGHIMVRGWCERPNICSNRGRLPFIFFREWKATCQSGIQDPTFVSMDTGYGIDPRKWDSVFESFEQAGPSNTRMHGGKGLGLCIVRNLLRKMGGDIKIVEKNGPGTLMRLSLRIGTYSNVK